MPVKGTIMHNIKNTLQSLSPEIQVRKDLKSILIVISFN